MSYSADLSLRFVRAVAVMRGRSHTEFSGLQLGIFKTWASALAIEFFPITGGATLQSCPKTQGVSTVSPVKNGDAAT